MKTHIVGTQLLQLQIGCSYQNHGHEDSSSVWGMTQ